MKKPKKRILAGVVILVFLIGVYNLAYAKTFRGKVIDADTKEPIEGAVVVAEWTQETTTPTATHDRLKDVKEVLTDKNGEWVIRGPRGGQIGNIKAIISVFTGAYFTEPPRFYIFKPGYCPCPLVPGIKVCSERMRPLGIDGSGEVLELPRLANRDDRRQAVWKMGPEGRDEMADKRNARQIKNYLRVKNEESRSLGLGENPMWKEIENEK